MSRQDVLDEVDVAAAHLEKALEESRISLPRGIQSMIRLEIWRIDNLKRWIERIPESRIRPLYAEEERGN